MYAFFPFLQIRKMRLRENDVKKGSWDSQAVLFGYKEGLNSVYIGTTRDPWAEER